MARIFQPGHLHQENDIIIQKHEGLFHVIPFFLLRKTNKVNFHSIPCMERITGIERVVHEQGALSPGSVAEVQKPWYMHPNQEDNLITLFGSRVVELYHPSHDQIETFEISAERIVHNNVTILDGPGILGWPTGVFHRNSSPYQGGSVSLNLGIHFEDFNVDTEFNIYDLDITTGKHRVLSEGHLDKS